MQIAALAASLKLMFNPASSGRSDVGRTRVLFVCMGNICRSPTAEAVFRERLARAGLERGIECDSAGTHDYHAGEAPDRRAQAAARRRGYEMSRLRARAVETADFARFDLVLAMDRRNLTILLERCPPEHVAKVRLFMDFSRERRGSEVPDPYYGSVRGFDAVLDMIEDAADGLVEHLRSQSSARA